MSYKYGERQARMICFNLVGDKSGLELKFRI